MALRASRFSLWLLGQSGTTAQQTWIETRSATSRAHDVDLDALERLYVIADRNAVRGFLMQRPFLVPLLFEAYNEIARFFSGSSLRLAIVTDPEDELDRHLTLYIVTSLEPDDAVTRLRALDTAWWLDALGRARSALSISITPDDL
jgi:hypothetical protein